MNRHVPAHKELTACPLKRHREGVPWASGESSPRSASDVCVVGLLRATSQREARCAFSLERPASLASHTGHNARSAALTANTGGGAGSGEGVGTPR